MLQHGDKVTVKRSVLKTDDQKVFPHAHFIEYINEDTATIEMLYIQDRLDVPVTALTLDKPKKKRRV